MLMMHHDDDADLQLNADLNRVRINMPAIVTWLALEKTRMHGNLAKEPDDIKTRWLQGNIQAIDGLLDAIRKSRDVITKIESRRRQK